MTSDRCDLYGFEIFAGSTTGSASMKPDQSRSRAGGGLDERLKASMASIRAAIRVREALIRPGSLNQAALIV
jgi:hypothetical protein